MTLTTLELRDGSAVRLQRATAADVDDIVVLLVDDEIARGRGDSTSAAARAAYGAAFTAIDADPAQLLVIGRTHSGAAAATCQLSIIPGLSRLGASRLQIEAVRTAKDQRGTGLGSAMIRWALEEGRRRGATLAQLTSDTARVDAHRFYEGLGFTASHTGFKLDLRPPSP